MGLWFMEGGLRTGVREARLGPQMGLRPGAEPLLGPRRGASNQGTGRGASGTGLAARAGSQAVGAGLGPSRAPPTCVSSPCKGRAPLFGDL